MKIYLAHYQIELSQPYNLASSSQIRKGVLIRLQKGLQCAGFSDLFPFEEFGDASLELQLSEWQAGRPSELVQRALAYADIDARARQRQQNLFSGMVLPFCHKQVRNLEDAKRATAEGFSHVKIKMGPNVPADWIADLPHHMRVRLDFNGTLKFSEFERWWNARSDEFRSRVDFVEDAFFDEGNCDAPLAWDWLKRLQPKIKIVKPLRESTRGLRERIVFTHSMGHRLGQATSLWAASRFYRGFVPEVCGLLPTFSDAEWSHEGPRLRPPLGLGFGFDDELASQKWERLT